MKTKAITLILTGTICVAAMTSAQANFRENVVMKRLMTQLDTNRNGQIDLPELQKRWNTRFNNFDKNYNKDLDVTEFEKMMVNKKEKLKRFRKQNRALPDTAVFKRMDKDNNQHVSHKEFIDSKVARFRRVDTDKDNALSVDELKAMKGKLQQLR